MLEEVEPKVANYFACMRMHRSAWRSPTNINVDTAVSVFSRCAAPGIPALARGVAGQLKKNLVTWKNTGAAKQTESIRSSMPPCPSIITPQSFAPRLRLTAESASPPKKPIVTMISDMRSDCCQVKGVIHHNAPPIAVVQRPPPTSPSNVFDGDTTGASLVRPKSLPKTYCSTSLS